MTYQGMIKQYANKFGAVSFATVSDVVSVNDVHGKDVDPAHMFDIETAEKIALITDNRRIQLCPFKTAQGWRMYVVLHETPSTVAVAVIESMTYTGRDPKRELQAARTDYMVLA